MDDVVPHSIMDNFADRMEIKLTHQIGAVLLGSLDAQAKRNCNLFRAFPFRQKLDDFALTSSKMHSTNGTLGRTTEKGVKNILRNLR